MIHKLSYILVIFIISTNAIRKSNFKLKYGNIRSVDTDYNSETDADYDKNAEYLLGSGARLVDWGGNVYVFQKYGEMPTNDNDLNTNEQQNNKVKNSGYINNNNRRANPFDTDLKKDEEDEEEEENLNTNTETESDSNKGNITQLLVFKKPIRAYPIEVADKGDGYVYIPAANKRGLYVIGQPIIQPKKVLIQNSEVEEPRINSDYPFNSFYNRLPRLLPTDQA